MKKKAVHHLREVSEITSIKPTRGARRLMFIYLSFSQTQTLTYSIHSHVKQLVLLLEKTRGRVHKIIKLVLQS